MRKITRNTVNERKFHFQDVIIPDAGTMRGLGIPVPYIGNLFPILNKLENVSCK